MRRLIAPNLEEQVEKAKYATQVIKTPLRAGFRQKREATSILVPIRGIIENEKIIFSQASLL